MRLDGLILRELAYAQLHRNALDEALAACNEAMSAYQSAGDRMGEVGAIYFRLIIFVTIIFLLYDD